MKGRVVHLRAASDTEALARVFAEYGRDAVVGEIRQVRKQGFSGLFGKKETEVSVRIKSEVGSDGDVEKFRKLVNQIGRNIRAEQSAGYFKQWESALKKFDIGGSLAKKLLNEVGDTPCDLEAFAQSIATSIPIKKNLPRVIAMVGPTGAGKTTTVAKLAGIQSCKRGNRVAIITQDTSRIGAVEQLRVYTKIMGIPFSVVSSPGELKDAMQKYSKFDNVYVDTTGRPPGNLLSISELSTFLNECGNIEIALVVSATTKLNDLLLVNNGYARLRPSSLIFTKLDETASLGSVVTFIHQSSLPLICVGTGQSVPHDIQFPDSQLVSDWVNSGLNPYGKNKGGINIGWQIS